MTILALTILPRADKMESSSFPRCGCTGTMHADDREIIGADLERASIGATRGLIDQSGTISGRSLSPGRSAP